MLCAMPGDDTLSIVLAVCTGLGLAAACGFRVFLPLFVLSIAARAGQVTVVEGFDWLGSTPALVVFAVASVVEIAAYYIPVVDNLLDTIATPAAAVAGAIVASAMLVELEPWLRWTLGIVAGGGLAASIQIPTAAMRGGSTVTTAGLANPGIATGELLAAGLVSGIAVLAPIVVPMLVLALIAGAIQWRRKRRKDNRRGRGEPQDRT